MEIRFSWKLFGISSLGDKLVPKINLKFISPNSSGKVSIKFSVKFQENSPFQLDFFEIN